MSLGFPNIISNKRLTITPTSEGVSPRAKSTALAGDVGKLFKFIEVPLVIATSAEVYSRRLLFQLNASNATDFRILNHKQYHAFAPWILSGGCLCIKYRIGNTVFRYKLLDHRTEQWSFFNEYNGELIKRHYCIEFWAGTLQYGEVIYGLMQSLVYQTSIMYNPTQIDESQEVTTLGTIYQVDDMDFITPAALPIDSTTMAWLTN